MGSSTHVQQMAFDRRRDTSFVAAGGEERRGQMQADMLDLEGNVFLV